MAEQAAEMMRGTLSEIAGKLTDTSSDGGVKNVAVFANNKDLDAFVKAKIERDKASALAASGIQEKQETT